MVVAVAVSSREGMSDAGQGSLLLSEGMQDRGLRKSKQMSNLSMHEVGFRFTEVLLKSGNCKEV